MRHFLSAVAAACYSLLLSAAQAAEPPPNFVFLYADDLGYGDLGCYGCNTIATPNLDKMAGQGMRFTNFYSCACVCTPSRAGLLTGRYPIRTGLTRVLNPKSTGGIDDSEITLAEALKSCGYATAITGKWHLGHLPQFLPTRHGFDQYFGIPYSNDMANESRGDPPTPIIRNETVVEQPAEQSTLTKRYTEETLRFIEANQDNPFFAYLPYTMPHVPLHASKDFEGKSKRGLYGDVVEEIDWSVGEILAGLERLGLSGRTMVVFSSDNGPWLIQKENAGSAGPLRDGKATTFEGGIREPCIVRWPGKIPAGKIVDEPAIMLDWFPTLVQLAGGTAPADRVMDGKDISPVLFGTGQRPGHEFFFYRSEELEAHRSGPWKLKRPFKGELNRQQVDYPTLLFNLEIDPSETTNLAEQNPEIMAKLEKEMEDFEKGLGPPPIFKR
jgi:arylsulfatase A-like enzyme